MRKLLLSCLLVLALVPGWSREPRRDLLRAGPARMVVEPVVLDPRDPGRRRVGALTYLWGSRLRSDDPAFGGFSALAVAGDRFTLLGDGGAVARFRLVRGRAAEVRFADLPAGPGGDWEKRDRDSEALAIDPASGDAFVAFERWNAILRYDAGFTSVLSGTRPRAMRGWPDASGPETLVRRADGSFVVIAEGDFAADGRGFTALVFGGDPTRVAPAFRFHLRPPHGWRPADATMLPDGRMVVLLRRFRRLRFASALMLVEADAVRPGAVVRGRMLAVLASPLIHDNFEGIAATRERGRTILWLLSDDNQSALQSTLLLKFALDQAAVA